MVSKRQTTLPPSVVEHDEIGAPEAAKYMGWSDSYMRRVLREIQHGCTKYEIQAWKVGSGTISSWVMKFSTLPKPSKK